MHGELDGIQLALDLLGPQSVRQDEVPSLMQHGHHAFDLEFGEGLAELAQSFRGLFHLHATPTATRGREWRLHY